MAENNYFPSVTAIVPCRNEERFIAKCLESIINNDYPKEKLEVLIVDGKSEDKTRKIVKKYTQQYQFLKLLENPKEITPAAMNIGIKNSKGEIIIKMDAHTLYEKEYISKCVKHLEESGADNVGGVLKTLPANNTLFTKAIALSLSHPFGAGTSYFRIGSKKSREVDTVAFGCYWKKIFEKIGLYNEKAERIEDLELNLRIRKSGGRILLVPDIVAYYYPQSTLFGFFRHSFLDGIWTTYPLKFGIKIFSLRHVMPLFFVSSLISFLLLSSFSKIPFLFFLFIIFLYFILSFLFSLQISLKEKDFRYLFLMPVAFLCRHFGYGIGSIFGLIKILI